MRDGEDEHYNLCISQKSGESMQTHPAGDVLWVFVEPGNVVP